MIRSILILVASLTLSCMVKAQDVYIQAEFEKNEGIILKWNYNPAFDSTIVRIASIISSDDKVWILYDPSHLITQAQVESELIAGGVNPLNLIMMEGVAENPWIRDYGPVAGYYFDDAVKTRHFVDAVYDASQYPLADFLPLQLASEFGFNYSDMQLNFEPGNLLLDGIGRGFAGDRVLSGNPGLSTNQVIQTLYTRLSLNEIIILPSIPECGGGVWSELSRLIKFIDSETVLVTQFPDEIPYSQQVNLLADTLSKMYNDVGRQFVVVRIPASPYGNDQYAQSSDGIIRSYTSSLIFNNKILIPSYGHANDQVALTIYTSQFPGYEIYQVPAQVLADEHGSLYRLAVNIPQENLFRIRHSKITGPQLFENEIWINAFVDTWQPLDSIQVFYKIHPSDEYQSVNTYGCCGGNSGFLGGYTENDTISYYLKAYSGDYSQSLPIAAPEGLFTFWFDPYTGNDRKTNDESLRIFPNPSTGIVNLGGILVSANATYEVLSLSGFLVDEGGLNGLGRIKLSGDLANGFYILKIIDSGKTHISKLYLHR